MGTVPIVNISPVTITRSDEPRLEPLVPVARIERRSANADETYSPSGGQTASGAEGGERENQRNDSGDDTEARPSSIEANETLAIDLFA